MTVCRDGKCRLWDVGQSNCLAIFGNFECIINGCDIVSVNQENMDLLPSSEETRCNFISFLLISNFHRFNLLLNFIF